MVDKHVEIGGELRPVNFGRNALVEFEELTGFSLMDGTSSLTSFKAMRALVYVGLKWGLYKSDGKEPKPRFTILEVGDWLGDDYMGPDSATAKVMKIFIDSMPKAKNVEAAANAA